MSPLYKIEVSRSEFHLWCSAVEFEEQSIYSFAGSYTFDSDKIYTANPLKILLKGPEETPLVRGCLN
jgi:hypothetical protein